MKNSHNDRLKDAWNTFYISGKVQDYISFSRLLNSTEAEGDRADTDKGSDNQDSGCK